MENKYYVMMKKILLSLLVLASLQACSQKKNNSKNNQTMTTHTFKSLDTLPQYPKEKQVSYIAHLNTKTPYELYLDDILIDRNITSGFSKSVELNPYLLENGTHTLKIRFFPPEDREEGIIKPKDIVYDKDVKWNLYFIKLQKDSSDPLGYAGSIDYRNSELPIVAPPTEVPVWEQEFKVEVTDLPYKLKGWSDGEDLSKLDQDVLEKEVVAFYQKLRNLLNEGKITEYMELNKIADFELSLSIYNTPERYEESYYENIEELTKECKGNMLPIDNYVMKIYAEGKLIRLEIPSGKYKYWSALMSDSKKYGKSSWGVMIYRPKGAKNFVIIR